MTMGTGFAPQAAPTAREGPGFADLLRDPAIRTRFTAWDRHQGAPDRMLEECASGEIEGNTPANGFTIGELLELASELADEWWW